MLPVHRRDMSGWRVGWYRFHGALCLTGGGLMAYYCYYLYSTDVTPTVAQRDLKGVFAWAVVSVVGAMLLLGGRARPQPGRETRRDTPDWRKRKTHDALILEFLFFIVLPQFLGIYHGALVASLAVSLSVAVIINLAYLMVESWWERPAAEP